MGVGKAVANIYGTYQAAVVKRQPGFWGAFKKIWEGEKNHV